MCAVHRLHEKIYENCLCVEFRLRGIPYTQQGRRRVLYKGELVGEYVPDLVVQQKLTSTQRQSTGSRIMSAGRCSTISA
jgi:GxxExxY protein